MDPIVTDLRRELEKARDALIAAQSYLSSHAEMNAAPHCAVRVIYSPLSARVEAAINGIDIALASTEQPNPQTLNGPPADDVWAALVADLDRCQHGRHEGDDCGDCGGRSQGNPHIAPNGVIGYDRHGRYIVQPSRVHKHDPAAWRRTAAPEEPTDA